MKKYKNKEEYVYKDLEINMGNKTMANVLYAGIETSARFTILWNLNAQKYSRKQNSRNRAHIKVHIHPEDIALFNKLSGLTLEEPIQISIN